MLFNYIFQNVNVTLLCITITPTMLNAGFAKKWCFHTGGGWGTRRPLSEFSGSAPKRALVLKRVLMLNLSHEFDVQENEPVGEHILKEWFPMTRFNTEVKMQLAYYILQSWTMRSQFCSLLI